MHLAFRDGVSNAGEKLPAATHIHSK